MFTEGKGSTYRSLASRIDWKRSCLSTAVSEKLGLSAVLNFLATHTKEPNFMKLAFLEIRVRHLVPTGAPLHAAGKPPTCGARRGGSLLRWGSAPDRPSPC